MARATPMQWHLLIERVERLEVVTGWGREELGDLWGLVNLARYEPALRLLERLERQVGIPRLPNAGSTAMDSS